MDKNLHFSLMNLCMSKLVAQYTEEKKQKQRRRKQAV